MKNSQPSPVFRSSPTRLRPLLRRLLGAGCFCYLVSGCAALTNPVADGIPVRKLPPELLCEERHDEQTIPINLLGRSRPDVYTLGPGDVLGIWFEAVPQLSQPNQLPPIVYNQRALPAERGEIPPALGLPFAVQDDGTLALPLIKPVPVRGKTVQEVHELVLDTYLKADVLTPEGRKKQNLIVTLLRKRQTHVLVYRQDIVANVLTGNLNNNFVVSNVGATNGETDAIGRSTTGAGYRVDLEGFDNDLAAALAQTGGFPASNSAAYAVIYRGLLKNDRDRGLVLGQLATLRPGCKPSFETGVDSPIVRIPLRLRPGEVPSFGPEDVILHDGDAVLIEARELEFFYTAGLLPPGEHVMPRDFDLNIIQAVTRVRGPLVNGAFSQSNLSGFIIPRGIGNPSPSLLTVLRPMPGGGQVAIRVDLNRALRDPRENILVQNRDVLVLQETPGEALTRYFTQQFQFNFVSRIIQGNKTNGTIDVLVP
jgi:protein involved in polysaccharide export with SLBB domain